MKAHVVRLAALVVAALSTACVDLNPPKGSPAFISQLQLGQLFVVRGDVMRDTSGNPVAPTVVAYDGAGKPTTAFTPQFFVTDTASLITVTPQRISAGVTLGTAHLVGQIGNLQTPAMTIYVTVEPTTIARTSTTSLDTIKVPVGADSAHSLGTATLTVVIRGGAGTSTDSTVGGMIVGFRIAKSLTAKDASPVAYLQDDNGNNILTGTAFDTTDASGNASRKLVVNSRNIGDAGVVAGTTLDSLIVDATAKYNGKALAPLHIIVPLKITFGG